MVKEYPYVLDEASGEYSMNKYCIAEIQFNTAMMELEQSIGLKNFKFPEQSNIFKNDDKRMVTWLYLMNLRKKYVSIKVESTNPFCDGKFYFNLEESLFSQKEILRKGETLQSTQHGPLYDSLMRHYTKVNHSRHLVWQIIHKVAMLLVKYQQAGLVHGNISLENIELMIKQSAHSHDQLTDLRITNMDFSYRYGQKAHTFFSMDDKFTRTSLPPE